MSVAHLPSNNGLRCGSARRAKALVKWLCGRVCRRFVARANVARFGMTSMMSRLMFLV